MGSTAKNQNESKLPLRQSTVARWIHGGQSSYPKNLRDWGFLQVAPNISLQRTFDPPPIFAFAKTVVASNAAELRR